ncbi:cell division protein PerM [Kitasatospora sp. NBC_01266]|uniref:cell division protein PerM n=1 Tax=Kitasatospora sp. NBC_01266 TaxID=2903572 RepID=UPI002E37182A|nr:DUF6350 family protein [Kitasatospora sp. NBC_01266]
MTHHLTGRPLPRGTGALASGPLLAGAAAALLGLAVVGAPVLVLWILTAAPQDSAADAAQLVGALWLLGHGGPLSRGGAGVPLALTPLLLTVLTALLLRRAAAAAAARPGVQGRTVPVALCAGYLAVALPVALACAGSGALRSRPLPDLVAVLAVAYPAALLGSGSAPAWWPALRVRLGRFGADRLAGRIPGRLLDRLRRRPAPGAAAAVGRAAAAALLVLVAGGALLLGAALPLGAGTTAPALRTLVGGSLPGALGLLLCCLLLMPNAVLWSVGYALGPGFALGAGSLVAPGRLTPGPSLDFPLLALVPTTASGWQWLVLAVPLLAGLAAAGLLARVAVASCGAVPSAPWRGGGTALAAGASALAVGLAVALGGRLAGGAVGAGRMAQLGPSALCGLAAAGWVAAVAVPGAPALRWWLLRQAVGELPA